MPFTLEVEFSGLCLYVVDDVNQRVGVLMPDGRSSASRTHADGTIGVPHAGYLRFDLGNLDPRFTPAGTSEPVNEGIHQFDFEELDFVIAGTATPIIANHIEVPSFEEVAPDPDAANPQRPGIRLRPNLFGTTPPSEVLMRTLLVGGEISGDRAEDWFFPNVLNPGRPAYRSLFARFVTWTRQVDSATIRIKRFDGSRTIEFPLAPPLGSGSDAVVRVKIANFCEVNPLEWQSLDGRKVDEDDEDFKFLYRLLMPANGATWPATLSWHRFPIPMVPPGRQLGVEDCLGGQIKGPTT